MRNREYTFRNAREIFVPVAACGCFGDALVLLTDYNALIEKGISGNWFFKNGYAAVKVKRKVKYVHRLIHANDNRDIECFFKSDYKLDLRPTNIEVTPARGVKWRLARNRAKQRGLRKAA
jgi:hypothetical protein